MEAQNIPVLIPLKGEAKPRISAYLEQVCGYRADLFPHSGTLCGDNAKDCNKIRCIHCALDTYDVALTNVDLIVRTWIERDGAEW